MKKLLEQLEALKQQNDQYIESCNDDKTKKRWKCRAAGINAAREIVNEHIGELVENWEQLEGNTDDQEPFDVSVARGDFETLRSIIYGL